MRRHSPFEVFYLHKPDSYRIFTLFAIVYVPIVAIAANIVLVLYKGDKKFKVRHISDKEFHKIYGQYQEKNLFISEMTKL